MISEYEAGVIAYNEYKACDKNMSQDWQNGWWDAMQDEQVAYEAVINQEKESASIYKRTV